MDTTTPDGETVKTVSADLNKELRESDHPADLDGDNQTTSSFNALTVTTDTPTSARGTVVIQREESKLPSGTQTAVIYINPERACWHVDTGG